MEDILTMYRKTLEDESKMFDTPNSCTINRAMELVASAYTLGKLRLEEDKLREKYAGLAMQAIISNQELLEENTNFIETDGKRGFYDYAGMKNGNDRVAKLAVAYADAMVEELRINK